MKYLLDTNVISEIQKINGNEKVKQYIHSIGIENLYLSAITIGEICFGIEKLPVGRKKHELSVWLYIQIPQWFNNRMIYLDNDVFIEWGKLCAKVKKTLPCEDSILAAVALCHNMTLVTRNTNDFEGIEGIKLLNPWDE